MYSAERGTPYRCLDEGLNEAGGVSIFRRVGTVLSGQNRSRRKRQNQITERVGWTAGRIGRDSPYPYPGLGISQEASMTWPLLAAAAGGCRDPHTIALESSPGKALPGAAWQRWV